MKRATTSAGPVRTNTAAAAALTALLLALSALAGCSSGGDGQNTAASTSPPSAGGSSSSSSSGSAAAALQADYQRVVTDVLPSVVQITSSTGLGSGVVYDDKGNIVTNAHVVGDDTTFEVTLANNSKPVTATLVAAYGADDLAVVRLDHPPNGLKPATWGDSAKLAVGQIVMAMGNPLGLSSSVTEGIVSAIGRTVSEPQGQSSPGATIADAVQTSAAINPGNSGGALVDIDGKVVGIPTLAATDPETGDSAAPGIGFAVPSNTVKNIADQIIKNGKVTNSNRAALGVTVRTVAAFGGGSAGVGVVSVTKGGPADKAGIQAGDIITSVAGTPVQTTSDLSEALAQLKPGDQTKVGLTRPDGSTPTVTVTLGELH